MKSRPIIEGKLKSPTIGLQPLISADELSTILNVSKRTIWRLLSGKRLPEPLRIGGSVRWRREQIDRWIEQGCPPVDSKRHFSGMH